MGLNYTVTDQSFNQPEINEPDSIQLQIPNKVSTQGRNECAVINSGKYPPLSSPIAPPGVFAATDELGLQQYDQCGPR